MSLYIGITGKSRCQTGNFRLSGADIRLSLSMCIESTGNSHLSCVFKYFSSQKQIVDIR